MDELISDYETGALHPADVKPALAKAINEILQVQFSSLDPTFFLWYYCSLSLVRNLYILDLYQSHVLHCDFFEDEIAAVLKKRIDGLSLLLHHRPCFLLV
jgi:hypothetical protein